MQRKLETYAIINKDEKQGEGDLEKLLEEMNSKVEAINGILEGPIKVGSEEETLQQLQKHSEARKALEALLEKLAIASSDKKLSAKDAEAVGKYSERCSETSRRCQESIEALKSILGQMGTARLRTGAAEKEMTSIESEVEAAAAAAGQGPDVVKTTSNQLPVSEHQKCVL